MRKTLFFDTLTLKKWTVALQLCKDTLLRSHEAVTTVYTTNNLGRQSNELITCDSLIFISLCLVACVSFILDPFLIFSVLAL